MLQEMWIMGFELAEDNFTLRWYINPNVPIGSDVSYNGS